MSEHFKNFGTGVAAQTSDNWRGRMPAKIANPEAWPLNYADGFNDALQLVYEETGIAPPPHDTGTERGEAVGYISQSAAYQLLALSERGYIETTIWRQADARTAVPLFTHKGMQASEGGEAIEMPADAHVMRTMAHKADASDGYRVDAERYRRLRDQRQTMLIVGFFGNGCVNRTIEEVDAAIDAARQAAQEGKA